MNFETTYRSLKKAYAPQNAKFTPSDGAITVGMLGKEAAGQVVSETQALGQVTYYSAVMDKANTLGSIPLELFSVDPSTGSRTPAPYNRHGRVKRIFTEQPCDYLTMQQFIEFYSVSMDARGAFYAYIERNDRGNIKQIIPFRRQANVVPNMDVNGNVYYTYVTNDGTPVVGYREGIDLLIVKAPTTDGVVPIPPIRMQSKLLGISLDQDDKYASLQKDGITAQMALSTDAAFKDANALQRMKDDWTKFRGPAGLTEIPIFEQGLKPVSLQLTPAEMEALENKKFTDSRILSMTGVPAYRVGMGQGSTKEGQFTEMDEFYFRKTLNPLLIKLEVAMNKFIRADLNLAIKFDRNAFFSGSPWLLMDKVEKAFKGSLLSHPEARRAIGYAPVEGAEQLFAVDNNNVTYGTWDDLKDIQRQIYEGQSPDQNQPSEDTDNE